MLTLAPIALSAINCETLDSPAVPTPSALSTITPPPTANGEQIAAEIA